MDKNNENYWNDEEVYPINFATHFLSNQNGRIALENHRIADPAYFLRAASKQEVNQFFWLTKQAVDNFMYNYLFPFKKINFQS